MSRSDYLIIGIVAVCLIALIYLIYEFSRLNKDRNLQQPEKPLFEQEDYPDYNDADSSYYEYDPAMDTAYQEDTAPVTEAAQPKPVTPAPAPTPAPTPKPAPAPVEGKPVSGETAFSGSGDYLVLAGSFRHEVNAEAQLRRVKKLGYPDAQITPFNYGAYATVLVGRYATEREAASVANDLKKKGVEAQVLKKRPSKNR